MLREAKTAGFERRTHLSGRRYVLTNGPKGATPVWRARRFRQMHRAQQLHPVALVEEGPRMWWLFEDRIFWEDEQLDADDVLALIRDRERRRDRKLERAHAALAGSRDRQRLDGAGPRQQRTAIPRDVRLAVWERDGGRCVACDASFELQYDHVIPLALGGADTVANLQILCAPCNQAKGAALA